jgi:hypothetical protein
MLLGVWGGLIPFVGPYLHFAFTPDRTWAYNSGRLYLSIVPGAAALLGGLLVLLTRSRAVGVIGGLLAAAGGAWFIVGQGVVGTLLRHPSISAGRPVTRHGGATAGAAMTTWQFLELLAFFTAVGIVIVFLGALAVGRFSMVSARDAVADSGYGDDYLDAADQAPPAAAEQYAASSSYPAGGTRPFPGDEPTQTQDRYRSPTGQFPQSSSVFRPSSSPE